MGDEAFRELSQMDPSAGDLITKVGTNIALVRRSPTFRHFAGPPPFVTCSTVKRLELVWGPGNEAVVL